MVTYFVVIGFQLGKGGILIAGEPREIHGGRERCVSAAKRLSVGIAGAIAFSRTGDPAMGDWEDAVILFQTGLVPEDLFEAVA